MWARHPVSSGSSWPVIVFGVSLWIGLRPLRPPQSRKQRVRCAKEPTHKPKLRASEKTHQTEGSWTRLAAATQNSSSWAPPLGGEKVPLKLPLPLSLVLFPRGVLAGVLVFLPRQACWQTRRCWLRSASTEDDRHARITRRGRRNAGKALASRPPGSPCSYVTPRRRDRWAPRATPTKAEAIAVGEEATMARLDAGGDLASMANTADAVERVKRQLG
jgi:hypothetical protein